MVFVTRNMKGVLLMTIISLNHCCRLLAIDPKTFRRWLALEALTLQPHPADARINGVTHDQLLLVAAAHRRTLPDLPGDLPPPTPTGKTEEPSPLTLETVDLLRALSAQIAALQQHLTMLTEQVHLLQQTATASPEIAGVVSQPVLACTEAAVAASSQPACRPTDRRKHPAQVLPVVEYGTYGDYVVICPKHGMLSLQPDSPEWFAWLQTLSSFRFVGKLGRLTAHREAQRGPQTAWRAHRQIHNRSYNHRLGQTECLTISVLEQAATALQSHVK
jgi:hypothetical protein